MAAPAAPKEEEKPASKEAPAPQPGVAAAGFKAWLPLIATFLAMPVLAYAMCRFVLLPQLQKGLGITVTATEAPAKPPAATPAGAQRETVPINKLLVNVAGTMGARYLMVSLSVAGSDPDFKAKMQSHDAQLKDVAGGVLQTKTLADLEKPGARNIIRSELISGFNNILGGAVIQEIYFTEFAIQ